MKLRSFNVSAGQAPVSKTSVAVALRQIDPKHLSET